MRRSALAFLLGRPVAATVAAVHTPNVKITLQCSEFGPQLWAWNPTNGDSDSLEPGLIYRISWEQWDRGCRDFREAALGGPGS